MKSFIVDALKKYGKYKKSEVIGSFKAGDKIRVVARHSFEKTITTARPVVEEHFFYKEDDINGKAYNSQVLVFIGNTPVFGFYKNKFANFQPRSSGVDNSLTLSLNMKAVVNGHERMNKEEVQKFVDVFHAYAESNAAYFTSTDKQEVIL